MIDPLDFVRPNILNLIPYSTARDEFKGGDISIWLDANESPYPTGLNRYPDPHQKELKMAVSKLKGIDPSQIFIGGAGSDEAIDITYRIFCRPGIDNAIAIAPSYGVYKVSAEINDIELREVSLGENFSLPVDALLNAADQNTRLIWICSPNNPTANAFPHDRILEVVDRFNGMVVVDEAYVDFSPYGSLLQAIKSHPNLIVLQTFSKAWGMASLRMGMAFSTPEIAELYARVKYPYNVNGPTQRCLLERIESTDIKPFVSEILAERERLTGFLGNHPNVRQVYPSDANFLLVKVDDADRMYDYLISHGAIVRNRSKVKGCEGSLRITIGTPQENDKLISYLENYS